MTDGPMSSWELEVSRADLSVIRVVSGTQPLGEGEVLLAVERLAVTANILTYASLGDELGYWRADGFSLRAPRRSRRRRGLGSHSLRRAPAAKGARRHFGL